MLNWMSCSPLLARKKRNLHPNHCGSRDSLCAKLGCCARTNLRSFASLPGTSTASQTVLLGCLPCLRYALLWCSLRNAHRQTGNLFGGSSECRPSSLSKTLGAQITLFHQKNPILSQE